MADTPEHNGWTDDEVKREEAAEQARGTPGRGSRRHGEPAGEVVELVDGRTDLGHGRERLVRLG